MASHHLSSGILFFKIILDTTLQHEKLKIPNKFTRKYGGNLPNPVFLKTPDDIEWKIYWRRDDDNSIWLQNGWKEFASYYSLSHGHLMLFKYQETCHLDVRVFDQTTFEIEYPLRNTPNEDDNSKHKSKNLEEVTPSPESRKRSRACSMRVVGQSSDYFLLPQVEHLQEDTGDATESVEGEQVTSEVAGTSRSKAPSLDEVIPSPQPCKKSRTYSSRVVGQSSNLLPIEVEQLQENKGGATKSLKVERITFKVAGTSISKPPSFTIVMKDSYVYGYSLVIPTNFVKEYLKEKPKDFLLQVLEGRWTVSYRNGRFCTGWNKFASDNHLNVGDVCVFELIIKSRSYCFKVTMIRLSEETCSPAMREARKFTSENPFFRINIRADDANDFRPRVPVFFMRKYLKDKQAVTLSFGNKLWPVNLIGTVRSKLSKGWSRFANESKVGARDVCIFELINKADAVFHVRIYRDHS